jgi:hypothetical protein
VLLCYFSLLLQAVLKTALSRLMRDHPYHTLYSLIALRNGDVDGGQEVCCLHTVA